MTVAQPEREPVDSMPPNVPVDMLDDGMLWLINSTALHPRGFALAFDPETRELSLLGDGSEPWRFGCDEATERRVDEKFAAVEALLDRAREHNGGGSP